MFTIEHICYLYTFWHFQLLQVTFFDCKFSYWVLSKRTKTDKRNNCYFLQIVSILLFIIRIHIVHISITYCSVNGKQLDYCTLCQNIEIIPKFSAQIWCPLVGLEIIDIGSFKPSLFEKKTDERGKMLF